MADPPPSRLSADDVYTAWRRRRRQITGARAALLLGVVTATVAGGISADAVYVSTDGWTWRRL